MTRIGGPAPRPSTLGMTRSPSAPCLQACGEMADRFVRNTHHPSPLDSLQLPSGWARLISFDGAAFMVPCTALTRTESYFSGLLRQSNGAFEQHLVDVGSQDLYHMVNYLLYDVAPPCSASAAERLIALAEAKCLSELAVKLRLQQLDRFLQSRTTLQSPVASSVAGQVLDYLRMQPTLQEQLAAGLDVVCCPVQELQDCRRIASKRGNDSVTWKDFTQKELTAYGSTRWPQERREHVEEAWQWLTRQGADHGVRLDGLAVVTAEQPFRQAGFSVGHVFPILGLSFRARLARS